MNGAESLVKTLLGGGIDVCFANPGTSELHFVSALDRVPGVRCVLGLFEGVVTAPRTVISAWRIGRQRPCCIWGRGWPMDSPTSTTRAVPVVDRQTSSAITRPITSSMTRL